MPELTVTVDRRQLKEALAELGRSAPSAIRRALNRTAGTARTQAVRAVAKEVRLPQRDLRPMLPLIPATTQHLEAKLIARGRGVSLMRLGARQTKQGVVYRGPGGPVLIRSAFIATMPHGGRNVFLRVPPSLRRSHGAWSMNLPIFRQTGPSIPKIVLEKGIFDAVRATATVNLAKNLAHETEYLLNNRGKGRG